MSTKDEQAQKIIELDGSDGYRSAAELVGPDRADELLADLIRSNIRNIAECEPEKGEVEQMVAQVRKEKGF